MQNQKREDREVDEGIVADFEDVTPDDGSGEDVDMLDIGNTDTDSDSAHTAAEKNPKPKSSRRDEFKDPQWVRACISDLFMKEREVFELLYNVGVSSSTSPLSADMFFIKDLIVPPNKFRPEFMTAEGEIAEAQQNSLYKQILNLCQTMALISRDMTTMDQDASHRPRDLRISRMQE